MWTLLRSRVSNGEEDESAETRNEAAVKALNSLQTNAALLESYKKQGKQSHLSLQSKVTETSKYLSRCGITLDQLDDLPVIHVTGTKGKGSTCAFCESILRHHGFKTGFYSSPHLVSVRERIRINGKSLGEEEFTKYFWQVYNALHGKKDNEYDMPPYFKFLTVMAFNVFLIEKVDIAIVEVGIGGEYDCTNVLRKVPVVGITSLGMDHMSLLGNSLEEIAWQKAGIFKPGAAAFTVLQPPSAWNVLKKRAAERKCSLQVVPTLDSYDWENNCVKLKPIGHIQAINASLALQLAKAWMSLQEKVIGSSNTDGCSLSNNSMEGVSSINASTFTVTKCMQMGLCKCSWPGRLQVLNKGPISFFLDGAHTLESILMCSQWFLSQQKSASVLTVLVFNVGGERDALKLLTPLSKCKFDVALFCPNIVERHVDATSDQANFMVSADQPESSKNIHKIWNSLMQVSSEPIILSKQNGIAMEISCVQKKSYYFPCVLDAVSFIEEQAMVCETRIHVLVTGSLHLVGCVMSILDPELSTSSVQFSVAESVIID